MFRVAPVHRTLFRSIALCASILALGLLALPSAADAGERRLKGAHGKRPHAIAQRHNGVRLPAVSGRRTDIYGYGNPRHFRDKRQHRRSGELAVSGRRTEGIYGWRGGDHGWGRGDWGGPGIYRVRDRRSRETAREKVKWLRAYDRPYDGFQNGSGYERNFGFEYGAPLILDADAGFRSRESMRDRVKALRSFDRPYDGYYNGRGYGPRYWSGTPQIIQVGPGGAQAAGDATVEGGCSEGLYCVVRLGPFTNSPKIITLNAASAGVDSEKEMPPGDEPEVYELESPESGPVK